MTIPEPILIVQPSPGNYRLGTAAFPLRTVINCAAVGMLQAPEIVSEFNGDKGVVTIKLGDKSAVYDRIGWTPAGEWICDLRVGR